MSDLAIPAYEHEDYVELSAKASQTAISRGQFVKWEAGSTGKVVVATADESGAVIGIAAKDEVEDKLLIYVGSKPLTVPGETSHSLAAGDAVYVASATEVNGEPEAGASAISIGTMIEASGTAGITFWPLWYHNKAASAAVS